MGSGCCCCCCCVPRYAILPFVCILFMFLCIVFTFNFFLACFVAFLLDLFVFIFLRHLVLCHVSWFADVQFVFLFSSCVTLNRTRLGFSHGVRGISYHWMLRNPMRESPNGCETRGFVEGGSVTFTGNGVYAGRGLVWFDVALGLTDTFFGLVPHVHSTSESLAVIFMFSLLLMTFGEERLLH